MDGRSLFVLLLLSGHFWTGSALFRQYHYINESMSWLEAQTYCRYRYTDLATVDSIADVNRLVNIMDAGYNGAVWIGLKNGSEKRWNWSNGDQLGQFNKWKSGEPRATDNCALLGTVSWRSYSCSLPTYFLCHNESFGDFRIALDRTWSEALNYCRTYHTDMSAVYSLEDWIRVNKLVAYPELLWFGLFQDSWEWSDKWNRFFRFWAPGLPSQISGSGECVGMSRANSGRWAQYSCDLQQPFVCHGEDKFVRKQIVRLKLSCNGTCAVNDPKLQEVILNEIIEKLKSMGLENYSKVIWRKGEGEEVFHEELNRTANSDSACRVP